MKETIRDVWAEKSLYEFQTILREWIWVLERLYHDWKCEDYPWWCNERASVGTLAAAVWRSGGSAFEEYISEKKREIETISTNATGRTDLFFTYNGKDYIGEAKQTWPWLDDLKKCSNDFNESLNLAKTDALSVHNEKGSKLAILFASPKISVSSYDSIPSLIPRWINYLESKYDYSARAFFFPKYGIEAEYNNRIYPGVGLFIKRA